MASPTIHFAGPDSQVLVLACDPHFTDVASSQIHDAACRHLPDREGAAMVLDFSETVQLYSMGITSMLQIRKFCDERGAPLVLAGLAPHLLEFLKMLKILQLFTIEATLDDAIARASKGH